MDKTQNVETTVSSPRGLIYDSEGKILAGNKSSYAVVFTRKPGLDTETMIKYAQKLSQYIHVSTKKDVPDGTVTTQNLTERDLKDFYIGTHPKVNEEKLTQAEIDASKKNEKAQQKAYQKVLDRITDKELNQLTPEQMKVAAIWRNMSQATNLTPTTIATHLSAEELANVGEHLDEFDGMINTSVSATREYPKGKYFFLGNVKNIPKHQDDNYKAAGYNMNDLVGTSNLEEQYEDVLRGVPSTYKFTKNSSGEVVGSPEVTEGRRGDDIQLTINSDLQDKIGDIIENKIKKFYGNNAREAYAVVMNPHTGAILAMAGKKYNEKTHKFEDASSGTILNAYQIGSSVKGATVLAGYQNNAIPGPLDDKPINFKGGSQFNSWHAIGYLNGVPEALENSSNVYMGTIVGKMAGFQISDSGSSYTAKIFSSEHAQQKFVNAVNTLRNAYGQFGLGVNTGIDLPFESTGFNGGIPDEQGKIMMFSIGQYDTYTPLQMAQYVSTLANGGYRLAPHLLESIHTPSGEPDQLGPTIKTKKTEVLNTIPNTKEQFDQVHKGFYLVTHGPTGTATQLGVGGGQEMLKLKIAAKTGTAQLAPVEKGMYNLALVGYAPYDDPQVAVALMCPNIKGEEHINIEIGQEIFKTYFEEQKK
nr:penicillin-binding protein 2 [Pullulanibacillus pueri]